MVDIHNECSLFYCMSDNSSIYIVTYNKLKVKLNYK